MSGIPEIRTDRGIPTLYVKDVPFFALSGEVHNSSAESLSYMEKKVWPRIAGMNLNTLVVPLYWNRIEAQEGIFDFTLLDGLICQAREQKKHLVFLWFGLWKNAESTYVPDWIKQNCETYFRVETEYGEKLNTISPLCEAAVCKDANAFAHVMKHIRAIDEEFSTVIMMQVENETGLLGTPCDYCAKAREEFVRPVPEILLELPAAQKRPGTWKEVFGEDAEEVFMACHMAGAVEKITAAGRSEYPLPCFTNAWLYQFPWYAGSYPSGGPVRKMHQVWKLAAPSLFTLAPDIYVPYAAKVMDEYGYEGNPLLVPEIRKDAVTASYALYALVKHNALCYSPFGIEDLGEDTENVSTPTEEMIKALKMDPLSFDLTGSRQALSAVYGLFEQMKPLYLQMRGTDHMQCWLQRDENDQGAFFRFKEYNLEVDYFPKTAGCPAAAGVVYELGKNRFLLIGMMSKFIFHPKAGRKKKVSFLKMEKGQLRNGIFMPELEMNGDEYMAMLMMEQPVCYQVELFQY